MLKATLAFALFATMAQPALAKPVDLSEAQLHSARCALVSAMVPDEGKVTELQRTAGMVYFLGKLKGQLPDASITDLFTRELILDAADNLDSYRKACGAELMRVGPDISTMGRNINALAEEQSKAVSPE